MLFSRLSVIIRLYSPFSTPSPPFLSSEFPFPRFISFTNYLLLLLRPSILSALSVFYLWLVLVFVPTSPCSLALCVSCALRGLQPQHCSLSHRATVCLSVLAAWVWWCCCKFNSEDMLIDSAYLCESVFVYFCNWDIFCVLWVMLQTSLLQSTSPAPPSNSLHSSTVHILPFFPHSASLASLIPAIF